MENKYGKGKIGNVRFNFVELAGSVGASGVTHYEIRPPQPSPQAMNRAAKWRGKQNVLTGTGKN